MKTTLTVAAIAGFLALQHGNAQAACAVDREEVVRALEDGISTKELADKLDGCVALESLDDFGEPPHESSNAIGQSIKDTGSTYYEALIGCGYQAQRKELTCPIEIRRPLGFGGVPALQPVGSYEYVLFCVDMGGGAGLVPVNTNGVHVHDEVHGAGPNWYMSAVVPANEALFSVPLRGQTFRARAILSWAVPPAGCNAFPVWGNQADFRIRLDP